jgi:methyl-accepting chemotaxis protein
MVQYRHMPIGRQIIVVACGLLIVLFAIVTLVITKLSMQHALSTTEQNLTQQVATMRGMLDAYFENVQARGNRQSDFFQKFLQTNITHSSNLTRTGSVDLPILQAGGNVLNANHGLLENFKDLSATEAAVLVVHEGKVYRAVTLLKKDGQFMDGTEIPAADPVAKALLAGESYSGLTVRNGQYFFSVVRPLKDRDGKFFGGTSVRVSLEAELKQIRSTLGSIVSGKTGYVYILRPTGDEKSLAEFVLHPTLQGKTVGDVNSPTLYTAIASIVVKKEGILHYLFADKEGRDREKLVALTPLNGWGWVLGVGSWQDEYLADSYTLRNILILVGLLAAALSGGMIYLLVNDRLRPLQGVVQTIDRMGAGDFRNINSSNGHGSENEVLRLEAALAKTAQGIRQLLDSTRLASTQVGNSATTVEKAMERMLSSSESESRETLSMAATMEEISTSITLVAENARSVVTVTQGSRDTARTGGQQMAGTVAEMERIAQEIQESTTLVSRLGERSQQISSIVNVIREIADQTNLLALNAAIEAARAGESGRGFAVVADEVRKLAERTAVSTHEISSTIQAIVDDTNNAVNQMEKVHEQMGSGVDLAKQTNETLEAINRQAESTLHDVNEIADAAHEQSMAVQAIASSVERVAHLSEENHTIADANLTQTVELRKSADQMQAALGRFQL